MSEDAYTRREFMTLAAAGVGGMMHLLACGRPEHPWQFFSVDEALAVDALTARIVPTDDAPGAREAGVIHFIDRQLVGPYKRHQPAYRAGLRAVRRACRERFGRPLSDLGADDLDAVLTDLEAGRIQATADDAVAPQAFFRLLVDHTMQGYYGPPRHGGNRNYVSYAVIGLDYPQILGRHRRPA